MFPWNGQGPPSRESPCAAVRAVRAVPPSAAPPSPSSRRRRPAADRVRVRSDLGRDHPLGHVRVALRRRTVPVAHERGREGGQAALAATDPAGAAAAGTIAGYPVATWLGDWSQGTQLTKTIGTALTGAEQSGTTPVFVLYAIPDRDCGGYSAGGFDERSYDAWVDQVTAALAGHRAAVIVEPDSLAMLSNAKCSTALDEQRYRILSRTVAGLTAAGVPAYLDAGNSNWVQPALMASRLNSAGVQQARGFFTNVANYYPTAQEQAYAQKVSAATGGSHYVIDTSRNGQGWRGTWCNGPGAGLGASPGWCPTARRSTPCCG